VYFWDGTTDTIFEELYLKELYTTHKDRIAAIFIVP